MSLLPPGRFLMPGDLEGSPALTFAPLELQEGDEVPAGSLAAMMERRFEAYKSVVVRPFFRDHFARLDRQIVLVDALSALNAGPEAVRDLETALAEILACFRTGRASFLSALVKPRIDRILFAATKADHLHHTSHDRLEQVLARMTERAIARAKFSGARIDVIALAAVRATREAMVERDRERLPAIMGTPLAGETIAGTVFDGMRETAAFPGDLPEDPAALFTDEVLQRDVSESDFRFLRFRPPQLADGPAGTAVLPHIRLDRAIQFLIGDRLR
jgi:predicted YcjX-like family ATPase